MARGKLFVVSGPSGVGKGTLVKALTAVRDGYWLSVSATTRAPREGEQDGVDYFFLSEERFQDLIDQDGFLEYAGVHGKRYGTPKAPVMEHLDAGQNVILEIDVQGAAIVHANMPESIMVFIQPPSLEALRERLEKRGTESADQISKRVENASLELTRMNEYDIVVKNDKLEDAIRLFIAIFDCYANAE